MREVMGERDEYRKVVEEKEGFKGLENTVIELSNLLVSKKNENLNVS